MSAIYDFQHTSWSENCEYCVRLKNRADAAIRELEAENKRLDKLGPISRRQWIQAMDRLSALSDSITKLEAANEKVVSFGQSCVAAGADWMRRAVQAEAWQALAREQMSDAALREVDRRAEERRPNGKVPL